MENIKDPSRRNFGKLMAGLGAATTVSPFMGGSAEAAEQDYQKIRKKYTLENGKSPIIINSDVLKRHKQTNIAFYNKDTMYRPLPNGEKVMWYIPYTIQKYDLIANSKYSIVADAPSVEAARSALALDRSLWKLADTVGEMENRGLLKWNGEPTRFLSKVKEKETDPAIITKQTKFAARLAGADLVGIAPLNRNWVYSNALLPVTDENGKETKVVKEIVFKDVEEPMETDTQMIIPESVNNVVVAGIAMNREMVQTAPSAMANGAVGLGYTRMALWDITLCEFIRSMGYIAIPCVNSLAESVPMAIEAGLGESSRMGVLITPEYGPNVRLTKVLTNMPLNHDKPIEFGVEKFCITCKKCARECPSKAITEEAKSFNVRNHLNQAGKYQWQNDYIKCHDYWVKGGTSCAICIGVCAFTKGAMWGHKGVEWLIDNVSVLDPVMLGFDDALEYGERRDVDDIWNGRINTYGLDVDHMKHTIMKGENS